MTPERYAQKYSNAPNYQVIAKSAYKDGIEQGRAENTTSRVKALEREVKRLRAYKKEMESNLNDPDWIAGQLMGM